MLQQFHRLINWKIDVCVYMMSLIANGGLEKSGELCTEMMLMIALLILEKMCCILCRRRRWQDFLLT